MIAIEEDDTDWTLTAGRDGGLLSPCDGPEGSMAPKRLTDGEASGVSGSTPRFSEGELWTRAMASCQMNESKLLASLEMTSMGRGKELGVLSETTACGPET